MYDKQGRNRYLNPYRKMEHLFLNARPDEVRYQVSCGTVVHLNDHIKHIFDYIKIKKIQKIILHICVQKRYVWFVSLCYICFSSQTTSDVRHLSLIEQHQGDIDIFDTWGGGNSWAIMTTAIVPGTHKMPAQVKPISCPLQNKEKTTDNKNLNRKKVKSISIVHSVQQIRAIGFLLHAKSDLFRGQKLFFYGVLSISSSEGLSILPEYMALDLIPMP